MHPKTIGIMDLSPQAPFVSVNLAVRQVHRPGLVQEVRAVLRPHRAAAATGSNWRSPRAR